MSAPQVEEVIYPFSVKYHEKHMAAVERATACGIDLGEASQELIDRAIAHGIRMRDACLHDVHGKPIDLANPRYTKTIDGEDRAEINARGAIGEALTSPLWGVLPNWLAEGTYDGGDHLVNRWTIDTKVRQGFLTLNMTDYGKMKDRHPAYLVLVRNLSPTKALNGPYVFLGAIPPGNFVPPDRFKFKAHERARPLWSITPDARGFIPAREFHPERW